MDITNIGNSGETPAFGKLQRTPRLGEERSKTLTLLSGRIRKLILTLSLPGVFVVAAMKDEIVTGISVKAESVIGQKASQNFRKIFLSEEALQQLSELERQENEKQQLVQILQLQSILDNELQEMLDARLNFEKSHVELGLEHENTQYDLDKVYGRMDHVAGTVVDLINVAVNNRENLPSAVFIRDVCLKALAQLRSLPFFESHGNTSGLDKIEDRILRLPTSAEDPVRMEQFEKQRLTLIEEIDFSGAEKMPNDIGANEFEIYSRLLVELPKKLMREAVSQMK
jgi:hypothetical protein